MTYNHELRRAADAEELFQSHPPCGGHVPLRAGIELRAELEGVRAVNARNLAAARDRETMDCLVTATLCFIGTGHEPRVRRHTQAEDDALDSVTVRRKGTRYPEGWLDVRGVPQGARGSPIRAGRTPIRFVRAVYRGDLA
ncbi:hypothetical protein ACFQ78_32045 [Streptomyces sp. NPDC056519]|uniref:hypothetical protein n=1 Tax=Streptomyces sp. NPDC056519 TaxID=3345849 RepID=UPI0036ADA7D0